MASFAPVTVTACVVFQVESVKVSDDGDTVPSLVSGFPLASRLDTDTVTAAKGRVSSATVKVAVPPASVA